MEGGGEGNGGEERRDSGRHCVCKCVQHVSERECFLLCTSACACEVGKEKSRGKGEGGVDEAEER